MFLRANSGLMEPESEDPDSDHFSYWALNRTSVTRANRSSEQAEVERAVYTGEPGLN